MKFTYSILLSALFSLIWAQQQTVSYTISPSTFDADEEITISINGSSLNESSWDIDSSHELYIWAWSYDADDDNALDCPTNGSWDNSGSSNAFTYNNSTDTYTLSFTPTSFFNRTEIGKFGFLVKAKDGSGDKKSQDIYVEVGRFSLNLISPEASSITSINSGASVNVTAETSLAATFKLLSNGNTINQTSTSATTYAYNLTPSESATYTLQATQAGETIEKNFTVNIAPTTTTATMPSWMQQGLSTNPTDNTSVGLALYAPYKDYVYVIGSFNNWELSSNYVMHRDSNDPDLFWIEIKNLNPDTYYTYQYQTSDNVIVADPYSTQVLSPYDDSSISASTYPDLPTYPSGQSFEVSLFKINQPEYSWTVTDFNKPAKEDLVVYELLIRDFTDEKNWQSLIDKIDYFKDLNINAIEVMPVMEFEGNNSWGYNPSFHYALDKAYGTPEKMKEFIDLCHQNGIAVILDIALNHASGRSPLERLWCNDTNGDGYGDVAANNPYFNQEAKHSYNVFYDFNHQSTATQYYVNRVLGQWINEYKIDGFRWDLTKGFTQNCSASDEACTNAYQQDRVDILKQYADNQWSYDADSYIIFEHLGTANEEAQWANYKNGIMLWNKMTEAYNQNTMGYTDNSDFNWMNYQNHGFNTAVSVGFGESHDEERLMYKNLAYGNSSGSYDIKDLDTALQRQKAFGAVFFTVPGPKMIWQFGELGYEFSINRCENGTLSSDCRTSPKPVAFTLGYDNESNRKNIYNTWADIIKLKTDYPVFKTSDFSISSGDLMPIIHLQDTGISDTELNNVYAIANFTTETQSIVPNFNKTGTYYNLLTNEEIIIANSAQSISLAAGDFIIMGNQPTEDLATTEIEQNDSASVFTIKNNPVKDNEIEILFSLKDDAVLSIYTSNGAFYESFKIKASETERSIPVSRQSKYYILSVETQGKHFSKKVLIK